MTMSGAVFATPVNKQISLPGYAQATAFVSMGAATGIDFVTGATGTASPGVAGGITSYGQGSGSFASIGACGMAGGGCGTIKDLASFAPGASSRFLTLDGGVVSIDLTSIDAVDHFMVTNSVALSATGVIHFAGFDDTVGTFMLTAQGDEMTSYSATILSAAIAVPEPISIALFGSGLAAVGLVRRKRNHS